MPDADYLRETAALIRETAQAATPGPWSLTFIPESAVANQHITDRWFVMGCFDGNPRNPAGPASMSEYEPDARHIASWSPPVALAVADWLDAEAEGDIRLPHRYPQDAPAEVISWACQACGEMVNEASGFRSDCQVDWRPRNPRALAVARAWRGDA